MFVLNCFREVMTNPLSLQFNWLGLMGEKHAFNSLQLKGVILSMYNFYASFYIN